MLKAFFKFSFFVSFITINALTANSQTAGRPTVSTVEDKANATVELEKKIVDLKFTKQQSYSLEAEKLKNLKNSISSLREEMLAVLDELRKGRFCNGCSRTASQLRKEGVSNVEIHFRENGGTRPAAPALIQQKTEEYEQKIATKEAELKAFEFAENEFTRKRVDLDRQIAESESNIDRLKREITALSKSFKEKVLKEAKTMHLSWVGDMLQTLAEKHYAEDRINIINLKLIDLDKEETKSLAESKDKINKKIETDKTDLNTKIALTRAKIEITNLDHTEKVKILNSKLNQLKNQLITIDNRLKMNLPDSIKVNLSNKKIELENEILINTNKLGLEENNRKNILASLQKEIQSFNNKIFEINSSIIKIQDQALQGLKNAFATKRRIIQDAKIARITSLENYGKLLSEKRNAYGKKNNIYLSELDSERIRVMNACSKASTSCYATEANLEVAGNWNKCVGCIGEFENYHHSNDPIYGCIEESPIYRQYYQSLMSGLSDSDLEALKRTTSRTRYDNIFKKVIN